MAEYDGLLVAQGGKCAVCDRPPKKIRLAVDHDHKQSGRESVRGLLCGMCNRKIVGVIERFKVTPERIAAYLRAERPFRSKAEQGAGNNAGPQYDQRYALTGAVDSENAPPIAPDRLSLSWLTIPAAAVVAGATAPASGKPLDRVRKRRL